jgi:hypothetical protein
MNQHLFLPLKEITEIIFSCLCECFTVRVLAHLFGGFLFVGKHAFHKFNYCTKYFANIISHTVMRIWLDDHVNDMLWVMSSVPYSVLSVSWNQPGALTISQWELFKISPSECRRGRGSLWPFLYSVIVSPNFLLNRWQQQWLFAPVIRGIKVTSSPTHLGVLTLSCIWYRPLSVFPLPLHHTENKGGNQSGYRWQMGVSASAVQMWEIYFIVRAIQTRKAHFVYLW